MGYTYYSRRFGATRADEKGWRLDYCLVRGWGGGGSGVGGGGLPCAPVYACSCADRPCSSVQLWPGRPGLPLTCAVWPHARSNTTRQVSQALAPRVHDSYILKEVEGGWHARARRIAALRSLMPQYAGAPPPDPALEARHVHVCALYAGAAPSLPPPCTRPPLQALTTCRWVWSLGRRDAAATRARFVRASASRSADFERPGTAAWQRLQCATCMLTRAKEAEFASCNVRNASRANNHHHATQRPLHFFWTRGQREMNHLKFSSVLCNSASVWSRLLVIVVILPIGRAKQIHSQP